MAGHWVLSGLGVLIGVIVAFASHQGWLALIPVFAAGALWFYSTNLKQSLFLGNGLVATLSALVVLQIGLYDVRMLEFAFAAIPSFDLRVLWWWIIGYTEMCIRDSSSTVATPCVWASTSWCTAANARTV